MLSLYAATSHLSGGPVIKTGWSKRSLDSIEAENNPQIGVSSFELAVTDPPNLWESYRTYIYIIYTQYIYNYRIIMDNGDRSSNYRSSIIIHFFHHYASCCPSSNMAFWTCAVHDFPSQKKRHDQCGYFPAMWMITSGQVSLSSSHLWTFELSILQWLQWLDVQ